MWCASLGLVDPARAGCDDEHRPREPTPYDAPALSGTSTCWPRRCASRAHRPRWPDPIWSLGDRVRPSGEADQSQAGACRISSATRSPERTAPSMAPKDVVAVSVPAQCTAPDGLAQREP